MNSLWLDVIRVGPAADLPVPVKNPNVPEVYYATDTGILYCRDSSNPEASWVIVGGAANVTTFAALPANAPVGSLRYVSDGDTGTPGAALTAGGGDFEVLAVFNGTDWVVSTLALDNS